jgi:uncharacterized protein
LIRLLVDASVLLSGVASTPGSSSPPALIVDALTDMAFEPVVSQRLISEVERGLRKPYFRDRIDEIEASKAVEAIRVAAVVFDDPVDPPRVLRDPDDDYLLVLASIASAQAIVTGDGDLLDHDALDPPAVDAREACELLGLTQPAASEWPLQGEH